MKNIGAKVLKKIISERRQKVGLPPGTLVHTGERKLENVRITVFDYNESSIDNKQIDNIEEAFAQEQENVKWINVDGLHDIELIEKIGEKYNIHPLVLEDIVHTSQRPKMEDFDDYIYVVLKMLTFNEESQRISIEQVSLVLGQGFVLTFQEAVGDVFEPVRERLINSKGRIRKLGSDYLLYALVDSVIDNYFVVLEEMGEKIESLQHQVAENPDQKVLHMIHDTKQQMLLMRKAVWPLRELISNLQKSESKLVEESTLFFLRDIYDHIVQIIDTTETLREMTLRYT